MRGKAGRHVSEGVTYNEVSWDAVVLEQIFLSCGAGSEHTEERLRRRRLLRRFLRRPAARIGSRRVKRKRLLDQLDREMLGPQFHDLRQQCQSEMCRILVVTRPPSSNGKRPASAPTSRAARWSYSGRTGRANRG